MYYLETIQGFQFLGISPRHFLEGSYKEPVLLFRYKELFRNSASWDQVIVYMTLHSFFIKCPVCELSGPSGESKKEKGGSLTHSLCNMCIIYGLPVEQELDQFDENRKCSAPTVRWSRSCCILRTEQLSAERSCRAPDCRTPTSPPLPAAATVRRMLHTHSWGLINQHQHAFQMYQISTLINKHYTQTKQKQGQRQWQITVELQGLVD